MALRDGAVRRIGLKTSGDDNKWNRQLANFQCEPGERIGLFKVFSKTNKEVILGQDDKHLDFRISLYLAPATNNFQKRLTISTAVKFNNFFGRLYFLPVRPFHKIIVPKMLEAIIKALETNNRGIYP